MENAASLRETSELKASQLAPALALVDAPDLPMQLAPSDRQGVASRAALRVLLTDIVVLGSLALGWSAAAAAAGATGTLAALTMIALATIGAFSLLGLYSTAQRPDPLFRDEARRVGMAFTGATFAWMVAWIVLFDRPLDRATVAVAIGWMCTAIVAALAARRRVRDRVFADEPERVLIIGAGEIGQDVAARIGGAGRSSMRVVGFFDDDPLPLRDDIAGTPVYGGAAGLTDVIAATGATRIIVAFTRRSSHDVLETIRNSRYSAIPISVVPRYFEITPSHATLSEVGGVPLVDLHSARLSRGAALTKRGLDLVLASVGVILLSPLFLGIAVAIKLTSRGPILFGQMRTGQNGRVFRMWKFRTMVVDAEARRLELAHLNDMADSGPLFKIHRDPRVTSVGRILRRLSLDEFPQLINVFNGSMSLVGPRPFVCMEADQMRGWSRRRLDLVPGMTGLWQISGRNDLSYDEMIRLDYMYVTNWSVLWDLRILLATVPGILAGRGAS